jgi:4-amino-4-deoxy-L-arabinose transferase-like glycosyltransferase
MTDAPHLSPANPACLTLAVIAVALVLRLAMAAAIGLGTDEIYTVAISRTLSWSYFDHPPLHQWITHATALVLGEGRQVRLPFIVMFAGTSWLLFRLTARLYGEAAGFWAVVMLNLSGFFTLSAGSWVVPDGALLFMLALAAWALAREFFPKPGESPSSLANWLIAGAAIGCAGLAKYHAVLAALGLGAYLLATPRGRRALGSAGPWLAAALALAIVAPVLVWNAQNGWVSFLFQSARTQGAGFTPWLVPVSLAAQAGWLLPWVFVPLAAGIRLGWKQHRDARFWFLMALALPSIVTFTLTPAFGNLGLPHWAMPGWFFVMPLAGLHLAALAAFSAKPARWARTAAAGSVVVLTLLAVQASTGWLGRISPAVSRNDPTLETFGWDQLPQRLAEAGLSRPADRFVISDSWLTAGRIDVALGGARAVLPGSNDPRHFAFLVEQRALLGHDAVIIVRARREAQLRGILTPHFTSLGAGVPISLGRGGLTEIPLIAIPATNFAKPLAWPYGRQP